MEVRSHVTCQSVLRERCGRDTWQWAAGSHHVLADQPAHDALRRDQEADLLLHHAVADHSYEYINRDFLRVSSRDILEEFTAWGSSYSGTAADHQVGEVRLCEEVSLRSSGQSICGGRMTHGSGQLSHKQSRSSCIYLDLHRALLDAAVLRHFSRAQPPIGALELSQRVVRLDDHALDRDCARLLVA